MGVMKKRVLLITTLLMFVCIQTKASVTVEQVTEPDYIVNSGYSEATAEQITVIKNRVSGQPAEPIYAQSHNKFVRFCRNIYGYLDPAQDTDETIHHNIHLSPSAKDL